MDPSEFPLREVLETIDRARVPVVVRAVLQRVWYAFSDLTPQPPLPEWRGGAMSEK
jgi:hypothetical protein